MSKYKYLYPLMLFLSLTLACGLPIMATPTPLFPTPDLTMTAIFSVLYITPSPTLTPPPLPSETPSPPPPTEDFLSPTLTSVAQTVTALASLSMSPSPTATPPPPTKTAIPTARPGTSISATFVSSPPLMDGLLGDWQLPSYPVTAVVYGRDRWDNPQDLSAWAMFAWDWQMFYIGVHVTDEDYVQNAAGEELYLGDSLEVLFDTDLAADYLVGQLSPDDFQLGISPGSPEPGDDPEAYLWFPRSIQGDRPQVKIAARRAGDGWEVEVAIPWTVFELTPQPNQHYGFAFSVSDNDKTGYKAQQTMICTVSTRILTNPTTWGDLVLYRP